MMRKFLFIGALFMASASFAQDDLFDLMGDPEPVTNYATATFKGTHIVNLQSTEIPAPGVLQFIISHRFGALNDDPLYNFLGMDIAQIRLGFDYGINDWLSIGIGRTSGNKMLDGNVKLKIFRQSSGAKNFPVSILYYGNANYSFLKYTDGLPHYESDRWSFVNQLIVARKFNENLSLELVPTHVHFNLVDRNNQSNDLFGLGFGGRYKLSNRVALTAEYMLQVTRNTQYDEASGALNPYKDALSVGVDIETGGHVFQLHLTNARAMTDPQWMMQTPGSWGKGDIYFGFNISRVFTLKKPKQPEAPQF